MAVGNNGSRIVGNTEFYGGLSTDNKIGIENSYADGECLDVRKSPSQMSVLPMSRKFADSGVITGLMTAMTQSKDGNIWGIDEDGDIYKIDEDNAIVKIPTSITNSGFSLEYSMIDDGLWAADGGHKLISYGRILNPTGGNQSVNVLENLNDNSKYIDYCIRIQQNEGAIYYQSDPDLPRPEGSKTCDVPTIIDETMEAGTDRTSRYKKKAALFLPAVTPITKIGVRFTAKGAGTVRIEIHDVYDNVLASSLSKNASDVSTDGYTEFEVRPDPSTSISPENQLAPLPWAGDTADAGDVLHIHIVASSSGYKVKTYDAGDMFLSLDMTCGGLVLHETFNRKHPMAIYDKLYIGNGRYVASKESSPLNYIDDTLFIQDALRLDDGFEVCCFGSSDEYLMIGAEKYSAGSSRGFQAGRIYFWDRLSEGPNFYIDCNMGSPKSIYNFGNIIYVIIAGALYAYTGGKELVKVRTLQGTDTEYSGARSVTEVYPNMMTIRREILLIGFPSSTTAYTIRHGIHAFGSIDKNYPNCFTYNYKIPGSTVEETLEQYNSQNQQLRIGCVYNFNDTLFYSYEVSTKVGNIWTRTPALALVDNDSGTSTSFMWKSLQYDAGSPAYEKMALRVGIYFDPLPPNTTIRPIYRIDDGAWVQGPAEATTGDRYITCEINKRFHELQYGFIGTTDNDNLTPKIKQVSAEVRILNEEAKL